MTILRPYQEQAIDSVFGYWDREGGSPLIEMATGTGKSVVIATIIKRAMQAYPTMRMLSLVHVRELVEQNAQALLRLWPGAPVGINSAGLRRRDTAHPILFASIQSVHRQAAAIGRRDLVLIDEAHLLPSHGEGMYHELLKEMEFTTSPDLRLFGCTATPYRLDSGRLDRGEGRLFSKICFTYGIGEGVKDGFLSPLVSKGAVTQIDVRGIGRRGGEFIAGALEAAADQEHITRAAVKEIVEFGKNRRSWLIFATSVRHAWSLRDEVRRHGVTCEVVSAKTPSEERATLLKAFKEGHLRSIANVSVLTTGFDAPAVDLIAMLRPTLSTGLYVQILGRGTRLAPGKTDCLVLDFSGNVRRHGPVDDIHVTRANSPSAEPEEVAVRSDDVRSEPCPQCLTYNPVAAEVCSDCGFQLREPKHAAVADTLPIMSGRSPDDWRSVTDVRVHRHEKRSDPSAPPTLRVTYGCGIKSFSEWICLEHPVGSYPRRKADAWWKDRGGRAPPPSTIYEAMDRFHKGELSVVEAIRTAKDGEHVRVISYRTAPQTNLLEAS